MFPNRDAIIFHEQRLTYAQLESMSAQAAQVLRSLGIKEQDRVGIVLPNVPAFAVWYFACLRLGAIAVSVSTRLHAEEVAFVLSDCGAKAVVHADTKDLAESLTQHQPVSLKQILAVSEDALQVAGEPLAAQETIGKGVYANMEPDQPAIILYTSGTTGFPKGATLSHRNVRATVHAFNHLCGMQTDDRLLLSVPLFHCYGQNALLNSGLNVGATIIMQRGFDLNEAQRLIRDHQITMLFGVPTTFQLLLESCKPADLQSVRYCFSAAARLPEQLGHAWHQKFQMPIYEGYGLTETAPFASYNHHLNFVPGSLGTPVDLVEMKIVDLDSREECPVGDVGEIAIRGPNVMLGYWNRPEETAAAVRDGWFYSGDIGRMDENGYFFILDRLKDMIVVGGLKVFPAEVERVLLDHPAVSQAAVVGVPDGVLGEKVLAFIVKSSAGQTNPTTSAELRAYCQAHMGSYKVPGQFHFLDELPRNPAGKVLKTQLRELNVTNPDTTEVAATKDGEGQAAPELPEIGPLFQSLLDAHPASRERMVVSYLQGEFQSLTGQEEPLGVNESIINEDFDSLLIVEFCDRLQRQVGARTKISPTIVFDHPKISDLATHLLAELEQGRVPAVDTAGKLATRDTQTTPASKSEETVEEMTETQAMEALLREVNDS